MLFISGHGGGTDLTGTIFERGEEPPTYKGAPDEDAPYVWICDSFYAVESGGSPIVIDGEEIRVAFESPMPRGFETREQALAAAKDHVITQFVRIGIDSETVRVDVAKADTA